MTLIDYIAGGLWIAALVPLTLRWLRVAQGERFAASRVAEVARLWNTVSQLNTTLYFGAFVLFIASVAPVLGYGPTWLGWFALPSIVLGAVVPIGLGLRGHVVALQWAPRLMRLVAVWAVFYLALSILGFLWLGAPVLAVVTLLAPSIMDAALGLLAPIEARLANGAPDPSAAPMAVPDAHDIAAPGALVIDNSEGAPAEGAALLIELAADLAAERGGDLVVVTPGLLEFGAARARRNREFAASIASHGAHLFAIGRSNRIALVAGYSEAQHPVRTFDLRIDAEAAAVDQAGERGVILYEGALPDHYP
jgi:hypothetical protein